MGKRAKIALNKNQMNEVLQTGARWAVQQGYGWKKDLEHTEEQGCMPEANPQYVSAKAIQRGMPQCGTLGSGNHFLELQRVEQLFDEKTAKSFGLEKGKIALMLHSGSRGLGHQIASDFIEVMQGAMKQHRIEVPDRQLACVPIQSQEGQAYLSAMKCGVNFAFCNRELMTHWARESFAKVFRQSAESLEMELLYDVCHNVAKEEEHTVDGRKLKVLVHRKGATRAMPAGRKENLKVFEKTGHPAIVPGSMGTASYVIVGTEKALLESFGTVCHGAGRSMSRSAAMKSKRGEQVKKELEALGEVVKAASIQGLAEEMPEAYKDVDEVVESVVRAGIGKKVARMVPVGVLKG